ncbi:unnamed protein product [Rotaria sp. Silwood1]|nr:unnamed protein product [Rotaria sp. Silwood1]
MKNSQLYILWFGTTLTSVVILLNYFQQRRRKKKDEERKTEYLKCKSLSDFEELAKKSMMPHRFYYYDYKAGQGHTYQACRHYFDKQLRIMPRVLMDVSEISLKTTIFGSIYESPILIATSACHCLAHVDGEVATARAATEAQCIFTYNWTFSNMPEEEVLQTLVFVDTGIRSGTDVLKALALGARAVFIGRPILYGLASGGQDGVRRVLDILKRELVYDMACCGLTSIDQINKDILYKH